MKELKNINKEFIILIIIFGIICINALIIIIMCLVFESDGSVPSIIMGLEAIIIGLVVIIVDRRLTKKKYPDCFLKTKGRIVSNPLQLNESAKWSKYPIIKYVVNDKEYMVKSSIGSGGIMSFVLKNRKKTVYYNKNNPSDAYTKNYISIIVGLMFMLGGILALIVTFKLKFC